MRSILFAIQLRVASTPAAVIPARQVSLPKPPSAQQEPVVSAPVVEPGMFWITSMLLSHTHILH